MRKDLISIILVISLASTLSGCAVAMAAKKTGTSLKELQEVKTRSALLAKDGVTAVSSRRNDAGELVEDYAVKLKKGSALRSLVHGALDVATLGVWEAVGTPVEGALGKQKSIAIRVYYDKDDMIKSVEVLE